MVSSRPHARGNSAASFKEVYVAWFNARCYRYPTGLVQTEAVEAGMASPNPTYGDSRIGIGPSSTKVPHHKGWMAVVGGFAGPYSQIVPVNTSPRSSTTRYTNLRKR